MKWLSEHNGNIGLSRRFIGTEEDGYMYVYQLYMDVTARGTRWQWGLYIRPDKIIHLQKFIKEGLDAIKNTLDGLHSNAKIRKDI
jgi:hypothetical protein